MSSPRDFKSKWTWMLDRYGLPITMLVVIGCVFWRAADWASPLAERAVDKHVEFLDRTSGAVEKIGGVLTEMQSENRASTEMIRDIHGAVVGGGRNPVGNVAEK